MLKPSVSEFKPDSQASATLAWTALETLLGLQMHLPLGTTAGTDRDEYAPLSDNGKPKLARQR